MNPFPSVEWPPAYPSPALLLSAAVRAQKAAYAPYSGFSVGAALFVEGLAEPVTGCNVENSSYGLSICAERNAAAAMIAAGGSRPLALAVAGSRGKPCLPCGACRQFLAEFNPGLLILLEDGESHLLLRLSDIFPAPFILGKESIHG